MHDNHTLRHIPYLIAKPDSLAVLLWSTIPRANGAMRRSGRKPGARVTNRA